MGLMQNLLSSLGLKREDRPAEEAVVIGPVPQVGDRVQHKKYLWTITAFADKVGLPPGGAVEFSREMDAEDERTWEAESLRQALHRHTSAELELLVFMHVREHGVMPTEEQLAALEENAKPTGHRLAMIEAKAKLKPRDGPRMMRVTALTNELQPVAPGEWVLP